MSAITIHFTFHFLRRDFQDTMISWIVFGVVFALGLAFIPPAVDKGFIIDAAVSAAGACVFFGVIYASQIRGQGAWNSQAMSREYLLSLPIDRRAMFRLSFVRASIGFAPLFAWGLFNHDWVINVFSSARVPYLREHAPASMAAFVVLFAIFLLASHVILTGSTEFNSLMRVSGRGRRFALITKGIARMLIHATTAVVLPASMMNLISIRPSLVAIPAAVFSVIWLGYHLKRAERARLTG